VSEEFIEAFPSALNWIVYYGWDLFTLDVHHHLAVDTFLMPDIGNSFA
jgi:hypothetical protein